MESGGVMAEQREEICYVNGEYVPKSHAFVSVYDSGFQHGTVGEVVPVKVIDARQIGNGSYPVTEKLREWYLGYVEAYAEEV